MNSSVQIVMAFLGSLGFSVLFNIRGFKLLGASLGGLLSWSMYLLSGLALHNSVAQSFTAALLITIYAEICARVMRAPTTTFLTASIIPLVPGSALYYTMSYAVNGLFDEFISSGVHTLTLAVALAAGIVVASSLYRITMVILQQFRFSRRCS